MKGTFDLSSGGYLSLMALVQHPDIFKVCASCFAVQVA
jgi:dipeptidyl aminopeptidase/acylaminoacyl peptidase